MNLLAPIYNQVMALVGRLTASRAAALDQLDAPVSTRAVASTALNNSTWSNARAGKLDNLDAAVTSRAPANTALSNGVWTDVHAARLDAQISTRMGIKTLRRGVIEIAGSGVLTATATLDPAVTTSKCELRLLGSRADSQYASVASATLVLTNSTTITAARSASTAANTYVSWELTEYL